MKYKRIGYKQNTFWRYKHIQYSENIVVKEVRINKVAKEIIIEANYNFS